MTLALLAAGAGGAWATRLDKTACADLSTELTSLLGSGLKVDMDKGPAWAAANLSPERLVSINRVIELQGVIEFRCNTPGRNVAKQPNAKPGDQAPVDKPGTAKAATAKSGEDSDDAAPATKPAQKARTMRRKRGSAATSPEMDVAPVATAPATLPQSATPTTTPTAPAAAPVRTVSGTEKATVTAPPAATPPPASPAVATPAKPASELSKTATTAPPATVTAVAKVTPVSTNPQATAEAKKTPLGGPVAAPTPAPGQAATVAPGAQKTAAKKKPSRRDSSSAYVSPRDVNPFSLLTGN